MKYLICLALLLPSIKLSASDNKAYFQQFVEYRIDAILNPGLSRIDATEQLIYHNNSPDTLDVLHFNLYWNRYKAGALLPGRLRQSDDGGIEIFKIESADSQSIRFSIDKTIMTVNLREAISPGDSVYLKINFASKIPPSSGRYGQMGDHFDIGNWYPVPAVYDHKGWHLHQYIESEFYQEWADYRVDLRVPKGFVVGATGNLLNPHTALSDTSKTIREWRLEFPDDTTTTLWQFEANMVHDFAWSADPEYTYLQSEWNGKTFNVLVMQSNREAWRQVTEWGPKAMAFFEERFGEYLYDQITVADSYIQAGGIEYPNIVFINSLYGPDFWDTNFKLVIIHELAHNWFYGLLANNQTEHEWMDEGFTTLAEILCMEELFGIEGNLSPNRDSWYTRMFLYENDDRSDNHRIYLQHAKSGVEKTPIDLKPDYFIEQPYTSQYSKMGLVLVMLKYTLGDSIFWDGMQQYYTTWRFRHPYPEDFIRIMEQSSNRDLDWFFDQWLKTIRQLDYAITSVDGNWQKVGDQTEYIVTAELERVGDIFMPIDLDIILKNGQQQHFHIPVDKDTKPEKNRQVLPYWHFSQKKYTAKLKLDAELENVIIDQSLRLTDVNRLNNQSHFIPQMEFVFMKPQSVAAPLDRYLWEGWPLLLYNDIDFLKPGIKFEGGYLDMDHLIDASFWIKTATTRIDFNILYNHPLRGLGRKSEILVRGYQLDGHRGLHFGISKKISDSGRNGSEHSFGIAGRIHQQFDRDYTLIPWEYKNINTLDLSWICRGERDWRENSEIRLGLKSTMIGSDANFSKITLDAGYTFFSYHHDFELSFRLKGGFSSGTLPAQYRYGLSGANGWEMFNSPAYRAKGQLPYPWFRQGHLYMLDESRVRGTALYGQINQLYGDKALILSTDLNMPNPLDMTDIPFLNRLVPGLFLDIGNVWDNRFPEYDNFRKSAGAYLYLDRFDYLYYFLNLDRIQVEFPVWLSHVPAGVNQFEFRWLLRFDFDLPSR